MLVSAMQYNPAIMVIKRIKWKTSRKLQSESQLSARQFWGRHLWARCYFVATSGNVTGEVIAQHIEKQVQIERASDEDFTLE